MDLPDCPPGAEGYEDSVIEIPKKPSLEEGCTKAEQEFQDHLNSLKIKIEDDETRPMVERRGRDVSGKWIYLCYPCAAVCSGESILQTHISGKKHKTKLAMRNIWPRSIFTDHPYVVSEKGGSKPTGGATDKILQKMAEEVDLYNKNPSELDVKYNKYRTVRCHIQDSFDNIKAPLLGLEYLIEHPPEQPHYEPAYICTLCTKHGHPRTIVNHMTCFWHRYNYLVRHFSKACALLAPYRSQPKYREGVSVIMNRLAQRIEDKYGRLRPVNIDKEEYDKDKERIHQWIFKGYHLSETAGPTFEEVVDVDLITSLLKSNIESLNKPSRMNKDPSPPVVPAPSKPHFNNFTRPSGRQERRAGSTDALSDISDEPPRRANERDDRVFRPRHDPYPKPPRYDPYYDKRRESPQRSRFAFRNAPIEKPKIIEKDSKRAPNYDYKLKLADEKRKAAEESAKKTLAYHEKNPEKHPLYPEEWKKFWNRRYKEIQTEGKDPSKHDFKPEWIVFWTKRMKELHDEELRVNVIEIHRKLCLTPPEVARHPSEARRRSPERRRSPDSRRPEVRRKSLERRRSPESRRRSPEFRREHRSPEYRRASKRPQKRPSPPRFPAKRSRSPISRARSPARTHIQLESVRRSRSPLSRRGEASRNRSPAHEHAASLQTVMVSDEELKPDDLSPWNSDMDSLGSLPDARSPIRAHSRTGSLVSSRASQSRASQSRRDYPRGARYEPQDLGPAENIVATLRMLVALEDYLGSLGPKIVDLLTEALKMEKDEANSSEELLVRESAVVMIETAKEKLKGAVQAELVPHGAAAAVRAAVVRVAATLHEADQRTKRRQQQAQISGKPSAGSVAAAAPMPVAGVGDVDRAQIAQQMAAALIAQGKTDVSSEELAQLVDAVVGMAEAKKREAEVKKKVDARATADKASRPAPSAKQSGTASALQMLQSAYDENDKKLEKEDVPDAMDGLSDSDLETLLKNFNELSAEEQHSLIAYLKKLEAREPQRVERLRQYVSAAAATAPRAEEPRKPDLNPVTIESDDDDYTVEDVFKSATQKVKEDQIRQEMEIVKKSLEETKSTPPAQNSPTPTPTIDLTKNISSATDLLALVQASIKSTSTNTAPVNQNAEVVTSNIQPRSFGDRPEVPNAEPIRTLIQSQPMNSMPHNNMPQQNNFGNQGGFRPQMNQPNFGANRNFQNEPYNQSPWEQRPNNMQDNRSFHVGPPMRGPGGPGFDNFGNQGPHAGNQGPHGGNQGPHGGNQGPHGGNQGPQGNFMNGRMQDNYDTRPSATHQQFGNFDQGNNFRGRGRGNFGGPMRGRGRGYY